MKLTEHEHFVLRSFTQTDAKKIIQKVAHDVIERSRIKRKSGNTEFETIKNVIYGEGMEGGVTEFLTLLEKYGK